MRVDGAHPLSVMVVAVSPRVRMVLRVGRCVEFMGVWLSGHLVSVLLYCIGFGLLPG